MSPPIIPVAGAILNEPVAGDLVEETSIANDVSTAITLPGNSFTKSPVVTYGDYCTANSTESLCGFLQTFLPLQPYLIAIAVLCFIALVVLLFLYWRQQGGDKYASVGEQRATEMSLLTTEGTCREVNDEGPRNVHVEPQICVNVLNVTS